MFKHLSFGIRDSVCDAFTSRHLPANPSQQLSSKAAAEAVKKVQMELGICAGGSPGNGARCLAAKSAPRMQHTVGVLNIFFELSCTHIMAIGDLHQQPMAAGVFMPGGPTAPVETKEGEPLETPTATRKRQRYQHPRGKGVGHGSSTPELGVTRELFQEGLGDGNANPSNHFPKNTPEGSIVPPAQPTPIEPPSPAVTATPPSRVPCPEKPAAEKPKSIYDDGTYWKHLSIN